MATDMTKQEWDEMIDGISKRYENNRQVGVPYPWFIAPPGMDEAIKEYLEENKEAINTGAYQLFPPHVDFAILGKDTVYMSPEYRKQIRDTGPIRWPNIAEAENGQKPVQEFFTWENFTNNKNKDQ